MMIEVNADDLKILLDLSQRPDDEPWLPDEIKARERLEALLKQHENA